MFENETLTMAMGLLTSVLTGGLQVLSSIMLLLASIPFPICIAVRDPIIKRWRVGIPLNHLTLVQFCACPKLGLDLDYYRHIAWSFPFFWRVFWFLNDLR